MRRRYQLGHNEFSDLTQREFRARLGLSTLPAPPAPSAWHVPLAARALPQHKDWVADGAVSHVKNQGACRPPLVA